jgi:hypothetical protein
MRRTQIYITEEQERLISGQAADAGVAKAEVIRRMLDQALGLDSGAAHRRSAILATAGIMDEADDWPAWLRRVRGVSADERLDRLDP